MGEGKAEGIGNTPVFMCVFRIEWEMRRDSYMTDGSSIQVLPRGIKQILVTACC